MPLNLHPECKKRLIEALVTGLPRIETRNGMFLEHISIILGLYEAEEALPKTGRLRDRLVSYVSDFPAMDFFSATLAAELSERDGYLHDTPSIKLVELEGYDDVRATAHSLVERFDSLPWRYTLSIELPANVSTVISKSITVLPLSDEMRLVRPAEDFAEQFPLKSNDPKRHNRIHGRGSILGISKDPHWKQDATYLQLELEGFVDLYGSTIPASIAQERLRAFCGLALAIRLFQWSPTYTGLRLGSQTSHFFVHRKTSDVWDIDGKFDIEDHHSIAFNELALNNLNGKLDTEEKQVAWSKSRLADVQTVFSSEERGTKILRASQWLFDSYTGRDELLHFVQSMVVLEILLGEETASEQIGLGELLRNRCAYLIGESHQQRKELMEDFTKIYRVRSQIVHSGKTRLTPTERRLFNKLRWMCRRVIQEELSLLKADIKDAKK